jgi:hypothetical protein
MRKRTLVAKIQDQLRREVAASDLQLVGGATITITQGSDGHVVTVQDAI